VFAAFDPRPAGSGIHGVALLVMLVWGLAALLVAVKGFRWEPKR